MKSHHLKHIDHTQIKTHFKNTTHTTHSSKKNIHFSCSTVNITQQTHTTFIYSQLKHTKTHMFHKAKNLMGRLVRSNRAKTLALMVLAGSTAAFAQNAAGDYSAGTTALSTVTAEIAKYIPYVVKLCYAIAGVVAVVGAVSVYISMNNEEQDVRKKIMMVVGACIFLVAAAQALPLFFGL
jgi:type IV secretory pathway VirB2 component (pilin)